jgi:NADP-dependent 3-hydroxy acid dehydrogenase YdfG
MVPTLLVTGATGGIGAAVVRAAADRGYDVLATGRDAVALDKLCAEVARCTPVPHDLFSRAGVPTELADVGRLDAVVHCAGIAEVASVEETSYALWLETLTVNVAAVAEMTRALLPALRSATGHVVFVNAAPGLRAVPRWSAYAASKAALREFADALRAEEAPNGIRVTTVYPAGTATGLLRKVREQFGHAFDPAHCIRPDTLATLILTVLEMRDDAYLTELSVLPTPRPAAP